MFLFTDYIWKMKKWFLSEKLMKCIAKKSHDINPVWINVYGYCVCRYCYIFLDTLKRSLKIYEASKIYNSINRAKIINFIPCKNPFPSFNCSSTCISHFSSVTFLLPCTFALSLFSFLFLIILLMKVCTTCKSLLSFRFVVS